MKKEIETPFLTDLKKGHHININGTPMNSAIYNMIISKRDISLYCKGMKPHRGWKVSVVKYYFGIKGTGENLLKDFMKLYNEHVNIKE